MIEVIGEFLVRNIDKLISICSSRVYWRSF